MSVTLEIPLPPVECSQNWRGHWAPKAKATAEYRQDVAMLWRLNAPHDWRTAPVVLSMEFYMGPTIERRYRPLDVGNAIGAMKAAIDGLIDAGMAPSDSHRNVMFGPVVLYRAKKEHQCRACVRLTVTPVEVMT